VDHLQNLEQALRLQDEIDVELLGAALPPVVTRNERFFYLTDDALLKIGEPAIPPVDINASHVGVAFRITFPYLKTLGAREIIAGRNHDVIGKVLLDALQLFGVVQGCPREFPELPRHTVGIAELEGLIYNFSGFRHFDSKT